MSEQWTEERIELIKRTICPKGISTDEFLLFIEQCKRSGLDPLLKEAFCVPRRVNIGNKEKSNWVTKHEFQPSEAGMLTRAMRASDFKGIQASAVYMGDFIEVDTGKGEVFHRFNPAKREGTLVGAWARVVREGMLPFVVWLDFAAYSQNTPLWGSKPATMIEKCARVAGLRKAYPAEFGGLYIAGERPDDVETEEEVAEQPKTERPALSPPAPRETLETSPAPEKVPMQRARGAEEAKVEAPSDDVENEALAIVHECGSVTTPEAFAKLVTRGKEIPEGTDARKRVAAALKWAHQRLTGPKESAA